MIFFYLLILLIFILFLNTLLLKKNILVNETGDVHQKFATKSRVPLTGGIFIFLGSFYFLNDGFYHFIFFLFLILILGVLSDLKLIKSAKKKLLLQIIFILFYTIFNDVQISDTRIIFLDTILKNDYINYFFVTFCILIIINGSNFIDGMNTLCIGYYLLIISIIYYLQLNDVIIIKNVLVFYVLIIILLTFTLNLINRFFLGDSGAYLLGFGFSILLISIYKWNPYISPYFIILLLWYPSYENLFSIFRKNIINRSAMYPDAKHIHQLIFFYIKKKSKLNALVANTLTGLVINLYNLLIFFIGLNFTSDSKIQILLIMINIMIYSLTYLKFFNFRYKKNLSIVNK